MKLIKKNWLIIVFLISICAIFSALTAEYIYKILPCKMCLYQRYPYYFMISISLIFFFINKKYYILYYLLIKSALLYGLFYTIWHIGIEQKFLPGSSGCTALINNTNSLIDLKNTILNQPIIFCDEINWTVFGLSAATTNFLVLLLLLIFNTIFLIELFLRPKKEIRKE